MRSTSCLRIHLKGLTTKFYQDQALRFECKRKCQYKCKNNIQAELQSREGHAVLSMHAHIETVQMERE